jgi:hypothetical protein
LDARYGTAALDGFSAMWGFPEIAQRLLRLQYKECKRRIENQKGGKEASRGEEESLEDPLKFICSVSPDISETSLHYFVY